MFQETVREDRRGNLKLFKPRQTDSQKILYFKDNVMVNLIEVMLKRMKDKNRAVRYNKLSKAKKGKKRKPKVLTLRDQMKEEYAINRVSKYFPFYNLDTTNNAYLVLPCGFNIGQSWRALKKCWKGYMLAKVQDNSDLMYEYARRIQKIEQEIGIPTASFPNLGLLGDIFFLYDKEKERELRYEYYQDNILCDKQDVEYVKQIIEEHRNSNQFVYTNKQPDMIELSPNESITRSFALKQANKDFNPKTIIESWVERDTEETRDYFDKVSKQWKIRELERQNVERLKQLLKDNEKLRESGRTRQEVITEKVIAESKLDSVNAATITKTDKGWRYCREIVREHMPTKMEEKYYRYHLCDEYGRLITEDNPYTYDDWLHDNIMREAEYYGYDIQLERELLLLQDKKEGLIDY